MKLIGEKGTTIKMIASGILMQKHKYMQSSIMSFHLNVKYHFIKSNHKQVPIQMTNQCPTKDGAFYCRLDR